MEGEGEAEMHSENGRGVLIRCLPLPCNLRLLIPFETEGRRGVHFENGRMKLPPISSEEGGTCEENQASMHENRVILLIRLDG